VKLLRGEPGTQVKVTFSARRRPGKGFYAHARHHQNGHGQGHNGKKEFPSAMTNRLRPHHGIRPQGREELEAALDN